MYNTDKVTKIVTGFLGGNLSSNEDIDQVGSSRRYAELLEAALKRVYPNAEIVIRYDASASGSLPASYATHVECGDEIAEESERAYVDQIANRVWTNGEWYTFCPETKYIVMTAAAHMPASCWGRYRKVAVVEIDPLKCPDGGYPRMISERARGVVRIVRIWDRLNVGKTDKCAYAKACQEAEDLITELNRD